jgi:diguanylate cyclase (GGDEF)-like protein
VPERCSTRAIDTVVNSMAAHGYGPLSPQNGEGAMPTATGAPDGQVITTPRAVEAVRDIQRASSELWALYEVAQTLSASLGVQETLDILARKLEAILPGTACLFLIRAEEDPGTLVARAVVGVNREYFVGCRTLNAHSLSIQVAASRQTYRGGFDPEDLLPRSSQTVPWVDLSTALIVPIIHQGEVLGTINLYHEERNAFTPHDQQLLEMIAERAAMALWNGLLYDRTRSHALTDPLTGLSNVRYLTHYVEERCQTANLAEESFAVLCIDLDSFKPINDNFGHQKGDEVLRELARIFQETVRRQDIVARYGGDEFLIVLEEANREVAFQIMERLEAAVAAYDPQLYHHRYGPIRIGASIGIACFPVDGQDCATLVSVADADMYRNKNERKLRRLTEIAAVANNTITVASNREV